MTSPFVNHLACAALLTAGASSALAQNAQSPLPSLPQFQADIKTPYTPIPGAIEKIAAPIAAGTEAVAVEPSRQKIELPDALAGRLTTGRSTQVERLHIDTAADGTIWVMGRGYKASFGPEGATYIPFFGSDAPRNFPIQFNVASATIGGEAIAFDTEVVATRDGDSISYNRGAFTEVYQLGLDSIEQLFVFNSPDGFTGFGDLRIELDVESELTTGGRVEGGLRFSGEYGHVDYSQPIVVDATGAQREMGHRHTDSKITLDVPQSFLASAQYPVVIDPVLSTVSVSTDSSDEYNSGTAYDVSTDRYLVVFERVYSATDHDIWSELWSASGNVTSFGGYVDYTTDDWRDPRVANNNARNNFLVTATEGSGDNRVISGRLVAATDLGMGGQFQISASGINGPLYQSDVSGDPAPNGPSYYLVTWARQWNSDDRDIMAQIVDPVTGVAGGTIYVDNTFDTKDYLPRISRSNGVGPAASRRWTIAWLRPYQLNNSDFDIFGAQIDWDGTLVHGTFTINFSGLNDLYPTISSPLDASADEDRTFLVTYERTNDGNGKIVGSIVRDGAAVYTTNLTTLEGVAVNQQRNRPNVDSDGRTFAVCHDELYSTSSSDLDVYVSAYSWNGSSLSCFEAHQNLAYSGTAEADPFLISTYSTGGARNQYMATWTDGPSGDRNIEGGFYETPPTPLGDNYCVAVVNSSGDGAHLTAVGSPSIADEEMIFTVTGAPANASGQLFFGQNAIQVPFGNGMRCVGGATYRILPYLFTDGGGNLTHTLNFNTPQASYLFTGTVRWQFWFRDFAAGGFGHSLSDGLEMILMP